MSVISEKIASEVEGVLQTPWTTRSGQVVPDTDDVKLKGGAVMIDATYLYADLADSSGAAHRLKKEVTGKLIRSYLDATSRVIKHYGGSIRSFDGDRVMGIFIGDAKNSSALKAGLGINWALHKVLEPNFVETWPSLADHWTTSHGVGIDTGEAMIVRGGVRGSNDLVSIGQAPNVAAKLSDLRGTPNIYATRRTFNQSDESAQLSADGRQMWAEYSPQIISGFVYQTVSSNWWMEP